MKVEVQGNPQGPTPWWVGQKVKCQCGLQATLDETDSVRHYGHQMDGHYQVHCPTCGSAVIVVHPSGR